MNGHETNTRMKQTGNVISGLRNFLLLGNLLVLVACGGGAGTEQLPPESDPTLTRRAVDFYNGMPEDNDSVRAYKNTVFDGLRLTGPAAGLRDRCGGCHTSTAENPQEPYFVQRDNVNTAYQAAFGLDDQYNQVSTSYINLSSPESSRLVTKMRETPGPTGHNCWEENKESCAVYIINRIQNMLAASQGGGSREIPLTAPQDHEIEVFRSFPDTTPTGFTALHNILQTNCADCHVPGGSPQGSPFFAVADADTAYDELRVSGKIVLGDSVESRAQSRIVVRPRDEDHGCWDTDVPADGQVNCPESAQAILDAIAVLVNSIPVQDPQDISNSNLDQIVTSKALTMADALVASGGNRYETDQIALYEFRTGVGRRILDLGATAPGVDLTLFGTEDVDYRWLGNFGIEFIGDNGRASANPTTVQKFHDEIRSTGAYSIEAWVVPNNTAQEDAAIASYSAASDDRNFGLEQNMYNYTFYNRLTVAGVPTSPQGEPALQTPDMPETAQAALQHVVVTYDGTRRQIYVNGRLNGATDTQPPGSLAEWRDDYQFILGNSERGDRPWRGALRLVAVHNQALTSQQIEQNFDVGVGEKFFMLFPLRQKDPDRTDNVVVEPPLNGIPDSCHIKFDFMQFDGYSYLFSKPTFVCLDPAITPQQVAGIQIRGVWLGINGNFPNAGQAFQTMNVTINETDYIPGRGQLLSNIGTTIELQNGPLGTGGLPPDQFFLGFEVIGAESTPPAYIPDPAANLAPPAERPEPAASSDIGLRTFDEINATLAQLTGLPEIGEFDTNGITVFGTYKQQLPTVENIDGFLPSHQMAIAQLALTYCDRLVRADINSGDGSSNGLFSSFNYNNGLNATTRQTVVNRFMADFMNYDTGANPPELATQPAAADVMTYLTSSTAVPFTDDVGDGDHGSFTSLMQLMDPTGDPSRTRDVVTGTCGAILGSAITIIQ